jgi:hypothetical protein
VSDRIAERLTIDVESEARDGKRFYIGRLTDLLQALEHASQLLRTAPFVTEHSIVNIIGNGTDNVGEDAQFARDRFVELGGTVNGVVLSDDPMVLDYYRQQVVGGLGAFVMSTDDAAAMVEVLMRKFRYDIAMGTSPRTFVDGMAADK